MICCQNYEYEKHKATNEVIIRRQIIKTTNFNKNPSLNRSCLSNKKIIKQLTGVRLDYLGEARSVGLII